MSVCGPDGMRRKPKGSGREINCDRVAWLLDVFDRYIPQDRFPGISRAREMKKYGMLYEVMEAANLDFEDGDARRNGTPFDVRTEEGQLSTANHLLGQAQVDIIELQEQVKEAKKIIAELVWPPDRTTEKQRSFEKMAAEFAGCVVPVVSDSVLEEDKTTENKRPKQ